MERLLLHCCCAPDATAVNRMVDEFQITLSFYNPNIHPQEEFARRLAEMDKVARFWNLPFLETPYDPEVWDRLTLGHREEMERSERCRICYAMRLDGTARLAKEQGFERFGTVLTVSPYKLAPWILEEGAKASERYGIPFLARDLKQGNGYLETLEWSKKLGIWRQNYCGCRYSLWQREEEERIRQEYRARLAARLRETLPSAHVALLLRREDQLCLVEGNLPTTPVRPGEKLKAAARRLANEMGVRIEELHPLGLEERIERHEHRIVHGFGGRVTGFRSEAPETACWVPFADLDARTIFPGSLQFIEELFKKVP